MIKLISSILIERPIKQVFDFISTPENDFQWQYGTLATASLPKARGTLQTFFRSIGHLMGHRNLSTFEVTEYEPNQNYGFKSLSGPVHSCTSYTLKNINGRTRLRIYIQASAPNFFKITEKLLGMTMKEQLEGNVAMLKEILEENTSISLVQQDASQKKRPDDPQRATPISFQCNRPDEKTTE
jgi:polyketide cyclase/dehydrase/lipid transport protein